jgi:hypothetical protein
MYWTAGEPLCCGHKMQRTFRIQAVSIQGSLILSNINKCTSSDTTYLPYNSIIITENAFDNLKMTPETRYLFLSLKQNIEIVQDEK